MAPLHTITDDTIDKTPNIFKTCTILNPYKEEISYGRTEEAHKGEAIGCIILVTDTSVEILNSGCAVYSKLELLCSMFRISPASVLWAELLAIWQAIMFSGDQISTKLSSLRIPFKLLKPSPAKPRTDRTGTAHNEMREAGIKKVLILWCQWWWQMKLLNEPGWLTSLLPFPSRPQLHGAWPLTGPKLTNLS